MPGNHKIIAVDFDGTLFADRWPNIGTPNWPVINRAKAEQAAGAHIILWTCREGEDLSKAVEACAKCGFFPDSVNANSPEHIAQFSNDPRKVGADEYWDDRSKHPDEIAGKPSNAKDGYDLINELCKAAYGCDLSKVVDMTEEHIRNAGEHALKPYKVYADIVDWDEYEGFVIIAHTKDEALDMVKHNFHKSQGEIHVEEIDVNTPGVILEAFRAG